MYHYDVTILISTGQLTSTFPVNNETANKQGGEKENQVAKHKETKEAVASLMNHHKRSGWQPFAWRTCVCVCVCECVCE